LEYFYAPCDFKNKAKQFVALPVSIDTARTLSGISLYLDYSENSGSALFSDIRFTAGEWSYTEYNEFHNPVNSKKNKTLLHNDDGTYTYGESETAIEYDNELRRVLERTKYTTRVGALAAEELLTVKKYAYNGMGNPVREESYIEGDENISGVNVTETVYNGKGITLKRISYNALDSGTKFYSESETAEDGKVAADIDETGENKTVYEYAEGTNLVKTEVRPDGSKLSYGRDQADNVTAITQSTEDGEENSTTTKYSYGVVTKLISGNNIVDYAYEHKRRIAKVELNGSRHIEYAYEDNASESLPNVSGATVSTVVDKVTAAFAAAKQETGGSPVSVSIETATDKRGNVRRISVDGTAQVTNVYDAEDKLVKSIDVTGNTETYEYHEASGQLKGYGRVSGATQILQENFGYNQYGQRESLDITGTVTHSYRYAYKDGKTKELNYITLPNGLRSYGKTDASGRIKERLLTQPDEQNPDTETDKFGEYIYYRKVGDHGTNQVSSVRYGVNGSIKDGIKYKYDKCGNISEVYENGALSIKYTYDSLDRLIREDNRLLGGTYLWTYDNCGNILSKRETAYSLEEDGNKLVFGANAEKLYDYNYANPDRLISYNGETIAYNEMGNPLTYRGKAMTWQKGSRLIGCGGIAFAYDGSGKRIGKTITGVNSSVTTSYTYDAAGKLIKQSDGLEFYYDGGGLSGFKYDGIQYTYRKNAQSDITHILDMSGNIVVKYIYNAWGDHAVTDTSGLALGSLNPFRYKSYYYDTETGFYYLKARYYDPETGRFISRDNVSYLAPNVINGLNLYAYCGNNAVMRIDSTGCFFEWIALGIILLVGAFTLTADDPKTIETAYENDPKRQAAVAKYTMEDLNINGSNPSGSIKIQFSFNKENPTITIFDSYLIQDKYEMLRILELIMSHERFDKKIFTRSRNSYYREWYWHNVTANLDINFDRAKDVDLDEAQKINYALLFFPFI
jgi:RHS repeat-associated protein